MAPSSSQQQDVLLVPSISAAADEQQQVRVGPHDRASKGTSSRPSSVPALFRQLTVQPCFDHSVARAPCSPFHTPNAQLVQAITQGIQFCEPVAPAAQPDADGPGLDTAGSSRGEGQPASSSEGPGELQGSSGGAGGGDASAPTLPGAATTKCSITATASCLLNLTAATGAGGAAPPHGARAVCGKRAKMEDTFSVQTNFADVPLSPADAGFQNKLPARIALQVGEQLEQNTTSYSNCSPPVSVPLSPASPLSCAQCLSSSDTEASVGGSASATTVSSTANSNNSSTCSCDTLHFFGVYDGHGGVEAAQHCANRLHYHLSIALAQAVGAGTMHTHDAFCVPAGSNGTGSSAVQCQAEWNFCTHEEPVPMQLPAECDTAAAGEEPASGGVLPGGCCCPRSADAEERCASCRQHDHAPAADGLTDAAGAADAEGAADGEQGASQQAGGTGQADEQPDTDSASSETARSEGSASAQCMTAALEGALRDAFLRTDEEFAEDGSSAMVGSTAVVALVGTKKMWIANCGDSRAVLCRGGKAIQVTDDHKPEREDEAERVEKAGGQVLYWNGHRVMGVLAMSRAIGDHGLRPYVIPEPEITVLARVLEDDFLLLASDGLWDVMTNQEAITLAMRCIQRSWEKGTSRKSAVRVAASVLTKAAVDRGSKDNVTVVIIDLKAPQPSSSTDGKQEGAATCGQEGAQAEAGATRDKAAAPAAPGLRWPKAESGACAAGVEAVVQDGLPQPWVSAAAAAAAAVAEGPGGLTREASLFQQDTLVQSILGQQGFLHSEQTTLLQSVSVMQQHPDGRQLLQQDTLVQSEATLFLQRQQTLARPPQGAPSCFAGQHPMSASLLQHDVFCAGTACDMPRAAEGKPVCTSTSAGLDTLVGMETLAQPDALLLSPVGEDCSPSSDPAAMRLLSIVQPPWATLDQGEVQAVPPQGPADAADAQGANGADAPADCQGSSARAASPWASEAELPPQIDLNAGLPHAPDLGTPTLLSMSTPLPSGPHC